MYDCVSSIFTGSSEKRSTTCSLSLLRTGGERTPGAKPTVSTTSTSFSQRPIEWPARDGLIDAGCAAWFMCTVRVKPNCPYCRTIVSRFCVMRFTGPSKVQSKMTLVVSQRIRGLSFGSNMPKLVAALVPSSVSSAPRMIIGPPARGPWPGSGPMRPSPGLYCVTVLSGTSAPPRPRGSVITSCSGAQSPEMFGSPLGRRGSRFAASGARVNCP